MLAENRLENTNLVVEQGATFTHTFTATDKAGVTLDLTGFTAKCEIKTNDDSATVVQEITATIDGDPTTGIIVLSLTNAQTLALDFNNEVHVYNVLVDNTATTDVVLKGNIQLIKNITEI